ncbi:MAG: sugar phosphate nucleotidyltransferase [Betaproteobacteria bacterium]
MSAPPTRALVLTAGLGTRLRPLTDVRAKPAVPVAGEPLVRRIIARLVAAGVADIVLNLHHRPETVTAVVGDGSDLSARVRYSWEPAVLGSAGGPRQALPILGAPVFFLLNGDTIADVDLRALASAHEASGALVTLALVPNAEPRRYGGVRLDDDGRVIGFVPRGLDAEGSYHFIGVQVVRADAFEGLPRGVPASSIGGLYDELVAVRRGSVRGVVTRARFWDIGTPGDYVRTSRALAGGDLTIHGARGRVDPSARLIRTILWDDVEIGADSLLEDCIVGDGVRIPPGAAYRRAILVDRDGQVEATPLTD